MAKIGGKLRLYFENQGIKQSEIAKAIGVNPTYITKIYNGEREIGKEQADKWVTHFGFSKAWLLTGEGQMFIDTKNVSDKKKDIPILDSDYRLVPIIHIDSVGGVHSNNDIVDEMEYIEGHVPFVGAREDDRAIYQSGESMIPTIPPGSLMQIREVVGWREYFGYGDIFVLLLTDGRRITKEITKYDANPKDYVWCVSHNPNVPDEELPRSMIVRVWKVIKVLTDKGW